MLIFCTTSTGDLPVYDYPVDEISPTNVLDKILVTNAHRGFLKSLCNIFFSVFSRQLIESTTLLLWFLLTSLSIPLKQRRGGLLSTTIGFIFLFGWLHNHLLREEYVSLSNGPNGSLCADPTACFFVPASACLLLIQRIIPSLQLIRYSSCHPPTFFVHIPRQGIVVPAYGYTTASNQLVGCPSMFHVLDSIDQDTCRFAVIHFSLSILSLYYLCARTSRRDGAFIQSCLYFFHQLATSILLYMLINSLCFVADLFS